MTAAIGVRWNKKYLLVATTLILFMAILTVWFFGGDIMKFFVGDYCSDKIDCLQNQVCNSSHSCQDLNCLEGYYPENHKCTLNTSYCFNNDNCSNNQICNSSTHSCQN